MEEKESIGQEMQKYSNRVFGLLAVLIALLFVGLVVLMQRKPIIPQSPPLPGASPIPPPVAQDEGVKKFASEADFKEYLESAESLARGFWGVPAVGLRRETGDFLERTPALEAPVPGGAKAVPDRVSTTTVQVRGIDEPDIVKTDGEQIYFSSEAPLYHSLPVRPIVDFEAQIGSILPPPESRNQTKVIKAFPPVELVKKANIDQTGDLLLANDTLIIFTTVAIYGYDVSNPTLPVESWKLKYEDNNQFQDARLYGDKIYLVTRTIINTVRPCPIKPFLMEGVAVSIPCTDIYHPITRVPIDVTYTVLVLDSETGEIKDRVSFVGSSGSSVVYMSQNAVYITYSYFEDFIEFFYSFYKEKGRDLLPSSILSRLAKLRGYELSSQTKLTEFETILEQYKNSLDSNERLRFENEMTNRLQDYSREHRRELERTGIVKIDRHDLEIDATGSVPGQPLNQFSLDEYQGNLRIATTVGENIFVSGGRESANDVYILDKNMQIVGSVRDLGLDERIYSARFIEDNGYVVTFRETDPFYVLDLSDPRSPQLKGELKISGYSSYLQPITKDKILGVGKEGSQVKLSLFDVSQPENPTEVSKYTLDEYWSDILNTHHAFLLDTKHRVFFLPGSQGGYIFSYQGDDLRLERAVSNIQARRAIYLDDYMYIIGDDRLVVVDERDWEEVNELEF